MRYGWQGQLGVKVLTEKEKTNALGFGSDSINGPERKQREGGVRSIHVLIAWFQSCWSSSAPNISPPVIFHPCPQCLFII